MGKRTLTRRGASTLQAIGLTIGILLIAGGALLPVLGSLFNRSSTLSPEEQQQLVTEYVSTVGFDAFVGDSPRKGAEDPTSLIFEFSDFQCPFCAQAAPIVRELIEKRGDSVMVVYKHLPLAAIHPEAVPAARASWAAGQQDKFWEYHDALFENQASLGEDLYVQLAQDFGLDVDRFNQDRNSSEALSAIEADLALANEFRFQGTPTFMVNDFIIPGVPSLEGFEQILDQFEQNAPNT
ncbi:MAG: DsbA family protein [Cyanobacteria bacterium J06597_1]